MVTLAEHREAKKQRAAERRHKEISRGQHELAMGYMTHLTKEQERKRSMNKEHQQPHWKEK